MTDRAWPEVFFTVWALVVAAMLFVIAVGALLTVPGLGKLVAVLPSGWGVFMVWFAREIWRGGL